MATIPAALQLKHYHFTRTVLEPLPEFDSQSLLDNEDLYPSFDGIPLTSRVILGEPEGVEDPSEFVVTLVLTCLPKEASQFPYRFELITEGLFQIKHDGDLDQRKHLVVVNGASILYGAMREHLLTLTARHRHGPVLLPCLDFRGLEKSEEES